MAAPLVPDNSKHAGKASHQYAPKTGSHSAGPAEVAGNSSSAHPASKSPSTYGQNWSLASGQPSSSIPASAQHTDQNLDQFRSKGSNTTASKKR